MGLFDILFGNQNQIPTVTTILPDVARQEIIAGRLPILNTDKLFLKRGEKIHFIDKAINMEKNRRNSLEQKHTPCQNRMLGEKQWHRYGDGKWRAKSHICISFPQMDLSIVILRMKSTKRRVRIICGCFRSMGQTRYRQI